MYIFTPGRRCCRVVNLKVPYYYYEMSKSVLSFQVVKKPISLRHIFHLVQCGCIKNDLFRIKLHSNLFPFHLRLFVSPVPDVLLISRDSSHYSRSKIYKIICKSVHCTKTIPRLLHEGCQVAVGLLPHE